MGVAFAVTAPHERPVRVERYPLTLVMPRCSACDAPLDRYKQQWCSPACRVMASRWRRYLEDYWRKVGLA